MIGMEADAGRTQAAAVVAGTVKAGGLSLGAKSVPSLGSLSGRALPRSATPAATPTPREPAVVAAATPRSASVKLRHSGGRGPGPPDKEKEQPSKTYEVRGHRGTRPEINGEYTLLRESWSGSQVYRNRRTQAYLLWHPQPPRWRIAPKIHGSETWAYADCLDGATLPSEVPGPWFVTRLSEECSCSDAEADPEIECIFVGQTVVVSGRSGHNQRLNGVFCELDANYGSFPAYFDKQKHMFIYRRLDCAAWVISNRLGLASRRGRGIIYAEVQDEAVQPYLVTQPWTVSAWGTRVAEVDANISVFLRSDTLREGPPAPMLTVRSRVHPEVVGVFSLQEGHQVNGQVFYKRATEESEVLKTHLFWDGGCWCFDRSLEASPSAVRSQRRELHGRHQPQDAVWVGVEVLRGDGERIDAALLASLRGRRAQLLQKFS